jgi:hypothetical protein
MDNDILEKWKTLLASLNVASKSKLICSEAQIAQVEKELGFKFPAVYPEYCRVFGSGSLGQGDPPPDFFQIYCPCCPPSSVDIRRTGHDLIGLKLDLDVSGPIGDEEKEKTAYRLLESGYAFGGTDRADSFMWDLTTYSEGDRSYDIYWVPDEGVEEITLVGRDFFEFVNEFCLGDRWKIMFPEEDATDTPGTRQRFFTAFEQCDDSRSADLFNELMFERFYDDLASSALYIESAEVRINCGYDAPGKEQAECLQRAWGREEGAEIGIITASDRPNIPRLVEVAVRIDKEQMTREYVESLLRKMIRIGEDCNCPPTSIGSGASTDS